MELTTIATYIIIPVLTVSFLVLGVISYRQGRRVGEEKEQKNERRLHDIHTS